MSKVIKVLAVADPAVMAYVSDKKILSNFGKEVQMDVFPWAKYYDTMMEVFCGKSDYDVVMVAGHLWKQDFVEKGYLSPIELEQEDILPNIVREMYFENKCYLSPSFCDGHLIVYRKSILKSVLGRELPECMTPQEYCEAAEQLASQGYRIVMKAHPSEIFTDALPFLRMYGGDVYNEQGEICCNNEPIIQGLEAYIKLKEFAVTDTACCANEEVAKKLQSKEAVMGITWSGQMGVVYSDACKDKEDLGFASLTTGWNVTWSFAVSKSSKNRHEAERLLQYLRSPQIDELAGACSGAPIRRESYLLGEGKYPWYPCQIKMINGAKLLPDISRAGDKNGILYDEIAKAFAKEKTAAEAMERAEERIKSI